MDALMAFDGKSSWFIEADIFSLIQSYDFSNFLCFPVKIEVSRHR